MNLQDNIQHSTTHRRHQSMKLKSNAWRNKFYDPSAEGELSAGAVVDGR